MAQSIFTQLTVEADLSVILGDGIEIRWRIDERECVNGPWTYTVLRGRSATGQMEVIAKDVTEPFYRDDYKQVYSKDLNIYYAVIAEDKNGKRHYSPPQKMGAYLTGRLRRIAREFTRQWLTAAKHGGAGVYGYHLRRIDSGTPCECVDPETGKVTDAGCPDCYGTAFKGGYYPPQKMWAQPQPDQVIRRLDPVQGMMAAKVSRFEVLAYPRLSANDFFVDSVSGLRYRIGSTVQTRALARNIPLLYTVEAEAEPINDIIYTYPIEEE